MVAVTVLAVGVVAVIVVVVIHAVAVAVVVIVVATVVGHRLRPLICLYPGMMLRGWVRCDHREYPSANKTCGRDIRSLVRKILGKAIGPDGPTIARLV